MKSNFLKYLALGLVLLTLIVVGACAKPAPLTPPPAEFEISSLTIAPTETLTAEPVTISVSVNNIGGIEGTYPITLTIDGIKAETKVVRMVPQSVELVSFTVTKDEPGIYTVEINGLSGTFQVLKPAEFTSSNLLITPPIAEVDQAITITADVSNTGEVEGRYPVTLIINGDKVETKELTVSPGATEKASFAFAKDAAGSYAIEVGGLSGLVIVSKAADILLQLNVTCPELYQELLKLPDLKEIDDKDDEATEDIALLALNPNYKPAFESMINEGIRDKRKYCTPLEALLWIAYDKEFDSYNPLRDYSLTRLMNAAWKNTATSKSFSSTKWQNFSEVVDRLNSPKLVEIYMQNNYSYSYTKGEAEGIKSAEQIFKDKKGACYDHAVLAGYCLKKNGYDKAQGMYVRFDRRVQGGFTGHIVCVYQDPEDTLYYTIDNAGGSRVHGPFKSIEDAAKDACFRGSSGEANLLRYSLHDIDLTTGKYKTTWITW